MTRATVKKKLATAAALLSYACHELPCTLFDKPGKTFTCDNCPISAARLLVHEKEEEFGKDETPD